MRTLPRGRAIVNDSERQNSARPDGERTWRNHHTAEKVAAKLLMVEACEQDGLPPLPRQGIDGPYEVQQPGDEDPAEEFEGPDEFNFKTEPTKFTFTTVKHLTEYC